MTNIKIIIILILLQLPSTSFSSEDYIPHPSSDSCEAFNNQLKFHNPKIFESKYTSEEQIKKSILLDCEVAHGNTTKDFKNVSLARTNIGDRFARHGYKYAATEWYRSAYWYDERELKKGKYINISSSAYKLGESEKALNKFNDAFNHFLLSAKRGHNSAQYEVGLAYMHGSGTIKNYIEAYAWFNISASYHGGSKSKQSKAKMEALEPKMTPASIENAQSLSKQYKQEINDLFDKK